MQVGVLVRFLGVPYTERGMCAYSIVHVGKGTTLSSAFLEGTCVHIAQV